MKSALIASLLLIALALVYGQAPCDVTIASIQTAVQAANVYRQGCEKSFFSSSSCDSYWAQVNNVLTLQISYQECGRQTQQQFQADVISTIQTEGNNTRSTDTANAIETQSIVTSQATSTRNYVAQEAAAVTTQVNDEVDLQAAETRAAVANAAENVEVRVSFEANNTRATVTADGATTRTLINSQNAATNTLINNAFAANTASLNNLQATETNFTTIFITLMIMMDFSSSSTRCDLFQRPAAYGGYFETMRLIVQSMINTNIALYGSTKVGTASSYFNAGEGYKNTGDYRRAWEQYRNAYLQAVVSY